MKIILLLSSQRSGTTNLQQYFLNNKKISCNGEIFNKGLFTRCFNSHTQNYISENNISNKINNNTKLNLIKVDKKDYYFFRVFNEQVNDNFLKYLIKI